MDIERALRGVACGERGIFAELYREMQPNSVRYATGLLAGDRGAAEDVVDEAFLAIWQQAGRFDGTGSGEGWIRRIVRNKAVDWLRKQREPLASSEAQVLHWEESVDDAPGPLETLTAKSEASLLRNAMDRLSMDHREVIWLCYFEDRSIAEIADISNCPIATVKTRLFYARKMMHQLLCK